MSYDQAWQAGSTGKLVEVFLRDSTTGQGKAVAAGNMTVYYQREGAASAVAVGALDDSMVLGTWKTAGWAPVDAANLVGLYQFGVPNAALAAGAEAVTLHFLASGMITKTVRIVLTQADLHAAELAADAVKISGDAVAADNLETVLDGTGGAVLKAAQLKLDCNVDGEGALHLNNAHEGGIGLHAAGGGWGQYNEGSGAGTYNLAAGSGLYNEGSYGQYNKSTGNADAGLRNEGLYGTHNLGDTASGIGLLNYGMDYSIFFGGAADKLDNLDAAVSTRAAPSDVTAAHATTDGKVDAVSAILSGITSLAKWLRGLFRSDAMDAAAKSEVNAGGGTFDETTDSLEAVRDTAPLGTAMRGTDSAALAAVCTEERLARLDADVSSRAGPDDVVTQVLPGALSVVFPAFTLTGASTQPFDLAEGAAVDVALVFQDSGENAVDLSGAHLRLRVFERGDDDQVFALDSETGGITVTDAEAGQATLEFSAANLATPGRYRYELWDVDGPTLYAKGDFVIRATLGPGS